MNCPRCHSLTVPSFLLGEDGHCFPVVRCVACGYHADPVIIANKLKQELCEEVRT